MKSDITTNAYFNNSFVYATQNHSSKKMRLVYNYTISTIKC